MECKYTNYQLLELLGKQINNYWGYSISVEFFENNRILDLVLDRLEECLKTWNNKYVNNDDKIYFKIEHSVSYSIFLYILSNELHKIGKNEAASYVYYLNKIMHSLDWFYAIDLPAHFGAEHPLGSVLGRAEYGDYFFVYQGCTVGGNRRKEKLYYPRMGNNLLMYANSTIIGDSYIGDNVVIAANSFIKDDVIPDNCIVFGQSPNLKIKERSKDEMCDMTNHLWRGK